MICLLSQKNKWHFFSQKPNTQANGVRWLISGLLILLTLSVYQKGKVESNMDDWWTPIKEFLLPSVYASPAVADAAEKYIGQGESGGNNMGDFIKSLGAEGQPWCSAFVSRAVSDAGENPFGYLPMARQWLNKGRKAGMEVQDPQRGDIAVFLRGDPKGMQGHTGIVSTVNDKNIVVIEGNTGVYPSHVKKITYDRKNMPRLLGYIRTSPQGHVNMLHDEYVERKQSFNSAFAEAKKKGLKEFVWGDKKYTTQVK